MYQATSQRMPDPSMVVDQSHHYRQPQQEGADDDAEGEREYEVV